VGLNKQNVLIYEEEVLQILYQLNEDSNSEIYTILRLSNATYIAKVTFIKKSLTLWLSFFYL